MSALFAETLAEFSPAPGQSGRFYSLAALGKALGVDVTRLPVSLRIVLESVLRHADGQKITRHHVEALARWAPNATRTEEIPFVVARIVLQDFTGVPLLADLAAMRNVAADQGFDAKRIEPLVPVDLVVDHSVQIDHYGQANSLDLNMQLEFQRNEERYTFLKWGMQAFDTFKVIPPGVGIIHQVNLEHLARGVHQKENVYYPDTLVGTDSHTTMINGIGVVGWGVGGIEAEAGMLGQPVYFLTPDVVGVHLTGTLREGVTATDLVLTLTEMLRKAKVVGQFVEFFGQGVCALSLPDRATIANMAPEYGATMGFFPVDEKTVEYFTATGRTPKEISAFLNYFKVQGLFGIPKAGAIDYSRTFALDLTTVEPSLAGPKRPQDRIALTAVKQTFESLFQAPVANNGFGQTAEKLAQRVTTASGVSLGSGDVLIAAITSCTNTSNPGVLIAAGLLAQKAVEKGLKVAPHIKTSLAPGSRVVVDYLKNAGLLPALEALGFYVAGFGCTTCIGNSGPLDAALEEAIVQNDFVAAAVLSGNRNFEARIHAQIKANFLASPPLVVAYALAGTMLKDLTQEPIGLGHGGAPVFLKDIWPTQAEVATLLPKATDPTLYQKRYANPGSDLDLWSKIAAPKGAVYAWPTSTYIAKPPFFENFSLKPTIQRGGHVKGARALAILGDSVTTDHISPAGAIKDTSPAGQYLQSLAVQKADFNSYGARRGHHEVMMRGTFANVRIKNLMLPPNADGTRVEGGITRHQPSGDTLSIYDAAMRYQAEGVPTVVFGGEEYGTGSSRDWAAKGTQLLGVKAVITRSFERIHRSNLVGMGVLPCQFQGTDSAENLALTGTETFDLEGLSSAPTPQQTLTLVIHRDSHLTDRVPLTLRIDTPIEVAYYQHQGILPFVLRSLLVA